MFFGFGRKSPAARAAAEADKELNQLERFAKTTNDMHAAEAERLSRQRQQRREMMELQLEEEAIKLEKNLKALQPEMRVLITEILFYNALAVALANPDHSLSIEFENITEIDELRTLASTRAVSWSEENRAMVVNVLDNCIKRPLVVGEQGSEKYQANNISKVYGPLKNNYKWWLIGRIARRRYIFAVLTGKIQSFPDIENDANSNSPLYYKKYEEEVINDQSSMKWVADMVNRFY